MLVRKLSNNAVLPSRGSPLAAGLDLVAPVDGSIEPGGRLLIPLDIAIELPQGTFGHILPRSGLALKKGIHVGAGVIDEDYRGNVGVLLFNLGQELFKFDAGDRIAQLVIKRYENVEVIFVDSIYDNTKRGSGGFGSSGV